MTSLQKYISRKLRPSLAIAMMASPTVTGGLMCAASILAPGAILANGGLFFAGAAVIGLGTVAVMAIASILDI